jgi:hypothetical protein
MCFRPARLGFGAIKSPLPQKICRELITLEQKPSTYYLSTQLLPWGPGFAHFIFGIFWHVIMSHDCI